MGSLLGSKLLLKLMFINLNLGSLQVDLLTLLIDMIVYVCVQMYACVSS